MKPFVILCEARSGSTMLASTLSQHPNVLMHGEVFGAHHFPLDFYGIDQNLPWPTPLEVLLKKSRDRNPVKFIDEFIYADTGRTHIGFKFKFQEFHIWPEFVDYIRIRQVPIIFLKRMNLFERYLSDLEVEYSGFFNSTDVINYRVNASDEILKKLAKSAGMKAIDVSLEFERSFEGLFPDNPILILPYERLIERWYAGFTETCRFLDLIVLDLKPWTAPGSSDKAVHKICDIEALRSELAEAGYHNHVITAARSFAGKGNASNI